MMAARIVLLLFVICLGRQTFSYNKKPCQRSDNDNAYDDFVKHHILPLTGPTTLDETVWERFIQEQKLCERPVQSFLRHNDAANVNAVCKEGGKVYRRNMCISRRRFNFITVRYEVGSCRVQSVEPETKHLILACDKVNNKCRPVHFEKNPNDEPPDENARNCS